MSRIKETFAKAKDENRAAFIVFLTAGYPNENDFVDHALKLLEHGDLLEVGIPYSDPLGDGPTVQTIGEQVLDQGMTTAKAFELIKELRSKTDKPIVIMTYYNPIYCYNGGEEGFLKALKEAGADGAILPDLPPDEATSLIPIARALALDTIFLIAPTSTDERLKIVAEASRGFIYAVSVTGVTGARQNLPTKGIADLVNRAKAFTDLPIAVGFGISNAQTANPIAKVADGVVVASAILKLIAKNEDYNELAAEIAAACKR